MKDRRIGRFAIATSLIDDDPESVKTALAGLIVVRAELRWEIGAVEYVAIGDAFEELPPATLPPEYRAILQVRELEEGRRVVELLRWERV